MGLSVKLSRPHFRRLADHAYDSNVASQHAHDGKDEHVASEDGEVDATLPFGRVASAGTSIVTPAAARRETLLEDEQLRYGDDERRQPADNDTSTDAARRFVDAKGTADGFVPSETERRNSGLTEISFSSSLAGDG